MTYVSKTFKAKGQTLYSQIFESTYSYCQKTLVKHPVGQVVYAPDPSKPHALVFRCEIVFQLSPHLALNLSFTHVYFSSMFHNVSSALLPWYLCCHGNLLITRKSTYFYDYFMYCGLHTLFELYLGTNTTLRIDIKSPATHYSVKHFYSVLDHGSIRSSQKSQNVKMSSFSYHSWLSRRKQHLYIWYLTVKQFQSIKVGICSKTIHSLEVYDGPHLLTDLLLPARKQGTCNTYLTIQFQCTIFFLSMQRQSMRNILKFHGVSQPNDKTIFLHKDEYSFSHTTNQYSSRTLNREILNITATKKHFIRGKIQHIIFQGQRSHLSSCREAGVAFLDFSDELVTNINDLWDANSCC